MWYARDPDFKNWSIPLLGSGAAGAGAQSEMTVNRLDWSADSQTLLVLSRGEVGPEGPLVLHNAAAKGGRFSIDVEDQFPAAAALSPDGRHVLVGTWNGQLLWFDLEQNRTKRLAELPPPTGFTEVAVAPGGQYLAAAAADGRMYIGNPRADAALVLEGGTGRVCDLRFSRDGLRLVSSATDGSVAVWNISEARLQWKLIGHDGPVTAAAFLADDQRIITAGQDDTVRIWNLEGAREEWTGQFECGGINTLALSSDGKVAAWAGFSGKIVLWDLDRHRKRFEITSLASPVIHLKFSPDGLSLAVAGSDTKIRRYNPETAREQPAIDVR
jgi:WD40 repeat protein